MRHRTPKLLEDIRDAAQFVVDETAGETFDSYCANRRLRQAVERNLEIIGEAMIRLSQANPTAAGSITARSQIIAFRNILIHGCDVLDQAKIWTVVRDSLPVLRTEIARLLSEVEE
jgi:uncharacterized protein with HEPN domain